MTTGTLLASMLSMSPGECRWVGREDLHVYCWGTSIDGRYDPRVTQFKLWTADSTGSVWDAAGWKSGPAVAREIEAIIEKEKAA
jgi:hypothetical protein